MRRTAPAFAAILLALAAPAAGRAQHDDGRPVPAPAVVRLVTAAEGNEARYRVREQLAGMELPNDAVGATSRIEGVLDLDSEGRPVPESSRFVLDMASLTSDAARRDNYLRRRTLDVESFPVAVLVPRDVRGLDGGIPAHGEVSFQLVSDLTIHGVTRPITWNVTARREGVAVLGRAETRFPFATFGLDIPKVGRVLSVDDDIRLEYDFRLVPEARP